MTSNTNMKKRRAKKIPVNTRIKAVLEDLCDGRMNVLDMLDVILTSVDFEMHQIKLYERGGAKLRALLDKMMLDDNGKDVLHEWMRPYAMQQVCETVQEEMTELDKAFCTSIPSITPAYVLNWTMQKDVEKPVDKAAPSLLRVIRASLTRRSQKNKKKDTTKVSDYLRVCMY
jgi:hypothetical protein